MSLSFLPEVNINIYQQGSFVSLFTKGIFFCLLGQPSQAASLNLSRQYSPSFFLNGKEAEVEAR